MTAANKYKKPKRLFREDLRASHRKGLILSFCAIAAILLVFAASNYSYNRSASKYYKQQAYDTMTDSSTLLASSISSHMRSWYVELNLAQQIVSMYAKNPKNYQEADLLLSKLQDTRFMDFSQVGLITEDGVLFFSSSEYYNAASTDFIQSFLTNGDAHDTYAGFLDIEALQDKLIFAIPYTEPDTHKIGGKKIAGIAACISTKQLSEMIDTDFFGADYAYVVVADVNGNVIVDSDAEKQFGSNVFDTFALFASDEVIETLHKDFIEGNSNTLNLMGTTRQFMTYYTPIWPDKVADVDDSSSDFCIEHWRLMIMTRTDVVTQNLSNLFKDSRFLLYTILGILLFVLLILIFVYIRNGNRQNTLLYTDALTGLLNDKRLLLDGNLLLQRSKNGREKSYAVVSYNVLQFKLINHQIGHKKADVLLQEIGKTIQDFLLPDELAARSFADRFTVLLRLDTVDGKARMRQLEKKLLAIPCSENVQLDFTIGIYELKKEDRDISIAIDHARFAQTKTRERLGQNTNVVVYSQEMFDKQAEERRLERRAEHALLNHDFIVYYQLKRDIQKKQWCGCEALIRWIDPEYGFLSPGTFIPLFERNGFVVKLDQYVFETVCADLRASIDAGEPVLPVSVNVSKCHLRDASFIDDYEEIINRYNIPHDLLEFEITEGLVVENELVLRQLITKLHILGCKCSLDDFGSGYSSFNMVKEFDFDTIKLDRQFFYGTKGFDNDSQMIVESLIELSHKLGKTVISEGVELEDQVCFLHAKKCDAIQGFFFSKPVPLAECKRMIQNG